MRCRDGWWKKETCCSVEKSNKQMQLKFGILSS